MNPTAEVVEKIAERYFAKSEELGQDASEHSHFKHVVGNILGPMKVISGYYQGEEWGEFKGPFIRNRKILKKYFSMMSSWREFAEAELSTREGYMYTVISGMGFSEEAMRQVKEGLEYISLEGYVNSAYDIYQSTGVGDVLADVGPQKLFKLGAHLRRHGTP